MKSWETSAKPTTNIMLNLQHKLCIDSGCMHIHVHTFMSNVCLMLIRGHRHIQESINPLSVYTGYLYAEIFTNFITQKLSMAKVLLRKYFVPHCNLYGIGINLFDQILLQYKHWRNFYPEKFFTHMAH